MGKIKKNCNASNLAFFKVLQTVNRPWGFFEVKQADFKLLKFNDSLVQLFNKITAKEALPNFSNYFSFLDKKLQKNSKEFDYYCLSLRKKLQIKIVTIDNQFLLLFFKVKGDHEKNKKLTLGNQSDEEAILIIDENLLIIDSLNDYQQLFHFLNRKDLKFNLSTFFSQSAIKIIMNAISKLQNQLATITFSLTENRQYQCQLFLLENSTPRQFVLSLKEQQSLGAIRNDLAVNNLDFEHYFNLNIDLFCITDLTGHFLKVNQAWQDILHYQPVNLVGHSFLEFIHPADIEKTKKAMTKLRQGKKIYNFVNRFLDFENCYHYLEWRAYSKQGSIFALARDITTSIAIETKLNKQKERFELAIKGSNDGIWDWDLETNELYLSPQWKKQLGFKDHDLPNAYQSFAGRIHPDDYERVFAIVQQYLKGNINKYDEQFRMRHRDGSYRWIRARGEAIRDQNKKAIRMAGSHTDVTGQKEKEIALEKSEHKFRSYTENSPMGIFVVDQEGTFIDVNKAACDLTGYTRAEYLKMGIKDFLAPEFSTQGLKYFETLLENKHFVGDIIGKKKNGVTFWASLTAVYVNEGEIIGFCQDITDRKEKTNQVFEAHNQMLKIFDSIDAIIYVTDIKSYEILFVNKFGTKTWGDLKGKTCYQVLREDQDQPCSYCQNSYIVDEKGKPTQRRQWEYFNEVVGKWYDCTDRAIIWSDGRVVKLHVAYDISRQKRIEQMVENEKEKFKTILMSVGDGVIATDGQGRITMMNKPAESLIGYQQQEVIDKHFGTVFKTVNEKTKKQNLDFVQLVLQKKQKLEIESDTVLLSKQGEKIAISSNVAPIYDQDGNISGVVVVFRDFTEYKVKQEQVEFLSFHDHLTGLYNRRYMEDSLKRLDTRRNLPFTIMIIDFNGLKIINDAFGHEKGDQVILKTVEIIKKACRADEIICRIGGDEFMILLPQTNLKQAENIKQRIIKALENIKFDQIMLSVAVGYAAKTNQDQNLRDIQRLADQNMYKDKAEFHEASTANKMISVLLKGISQNYNQEQLHSERVAFYAEEIAKRMSLTEKCIEEIKISALLHDIGKIMIPQTVLFKKEKLTDAEYAQIKKHPEFAYQILNNSKEYHDIAKYVLYHHEHFDGSGYPAGLKGTEIPLAARILAVADAYEAMTALRVYRKKKTMQEAISELKKYAGTQFDPEVVKVFINLLKELQ